MTTTHLHLVEDAPAKEESTWPVLDSLDEFLSAIGRYPLLSAAEEVALSKRIERGDDGARRRMIESNLRLVVTIAKEYRSSGVPFLDLIQDGMLGLIRAVDGFDWRLGNRFSTYAGWWIHQSIRRALAETSRPIRIPVRLGARARRVEHVAAALAAELGREPTEDEVARAAGLTAKQLRAAREAATTQRTASLDAVASDDDRALVDTITDESLADPGDGLDTPEEVTVTLAVSELPEQARRVIELRYGLDGEGERSYAAVAEVLGVSVWRVREIETRALHLLRQCDEVRGLRAV